MSLSPPPANEVNPLSRSWIKWFTDVYNYVKNGDAWPIGSIYTSVVSTNPSTLLGFGTWSAFGAGRVLVGLDAGQTEFDTVEETGGEKTHLLTGSESGTSAHSHNLKVSGSATPGTAGVFRNDALDGAAAGYIANSTAANAASAHNNLQPYLVVYFWKRVS